MATMLYVENVTDLFRAYTDEPDLSFLTNVDTQTSLEIAYNEFRQKATGMAPGIFATNVTIAPNGSTYNLSTAAVSILGAAPTNTRMARLLSVRDSTPALSASAPLWLGVSSRRALQVARRAYYLEGQVLEFSVTVTGNLILQYVPESTVNWANNTAGSNEFIDDLVEFHDIIALMAYAQYAIRDSSTSEQIQRQIASRLREMESTIARRNFAGPHYVARTDYSYEDV